ncbi:PEP-utilizing enzyme, partial [Priestia megaterium]|uniref:PEP-utilizing enzyme n=1 Tax=Priestia megaterium TaxID=1404 RepID=UPI00284D837B
VDMEREGLIDRETAVMRIEPGQIDQLLHPRFDEEELKGVSVIAKGLPASPGAVSGKIYFNDLEAEAAVKKGEKAILVRETTSPEDLAGMIAAGGILTAKG